MTDAAAGQTGSTRRPDLDWLRVLAILSLLPYHTALIFDADGWVIADATRSVVLAEVCEFFTQWRMPLMFVLAGIATWTALGFRAPGRFAAGRVRRLVVPLAAGILLVLPPQLYYTSGAAAAGESLV
jgi:peptidoglycan/LPS O-acetylase OafA/YrhL